MSSNRRNSHKYIMSEMRELGLSSEGGVCNGIVVTALQADVQGKLERFGRLFEYIWEHEDWRKRFDLSLQNRYAKESSASTSEIQSLIDSYVFLNLIAINHDPFKHRNFLLGNIHSQKEIERFSQVTGSLELEKAGGLKRVYLDELILSPVEWCGYFEELRTIFQELQIDDEAHMSIRIELIDIYSGDKEKTHDSGHAILLSYNQKAKKWVIVEPEILPQKFIEDDLEESFKKLAPPEKINYFPPTAFRNGSILSLLEHLDYLKEDDTYLCASLQAFTTSTNPQMEVISSRFEKMRHVERLYCDTPDKLHQRSTSTGLGLMHLASAFDDSERIEEMLKKGVDVNQVFAGKKVTPLLVAVHSNSVSALEKLIQKGAGLSHKFHGRNALHLAADTNATECMSILLRPEYKMDVNAEVDLHAETHAGMTAAQISAEKNDLKTLKLLIDAGADIAKVNSKGFALIHYAAKYNATDVIQFILSPPHNVEVDIPNKEFGNTAMDYAATCGYTELAKLLLEYKSQPRQMEKPHHFVPLVTAAQYNRVEIVKLLLPGKNSIMTLNYAFFMAAQNGYTEVIEVFLNAKIAPSCAVKGNVKTLLEFAEKRNCVENVKLLFKNKNINTEIEALSALHIAAFRGHIAIVKLLLAANVDVTQKSEGGITALDLALAMGQKAIVALLTNPKEFKELPSESKCDSFFIDPKLDPQVTKKEKPSAYNGFFCFRDSSEKSKDLPDSLNECDTFKTPNSYS